MIEFELLPTPNAQFGPYFVKYNKCTSLLANTIGPTIDPERLRTLVGHLQAIASVQQAVEDYNKLVQAEGTELWNDTLIFSSKKV